ncbi:hypothetical protein Pcinc_005711 [Petrolisthes cinctipes]|uniref:Uncharacterized protein n=1 Tax=Petrolisthes cinctipes TaxID=88211 RepID=A0AAE1GEL2_PETCI|nr:hypothetical protein Pcinc_005711 [Petrolisthes cinctipes]
MRGIVSFRNSETALRRWSLTMTQRALAVTELRALTGLEISEQATVQCRPSRIRKDNDQIKFLSEKIDESCNPFSVDAPTSLVNVATGYAASKTTENYLLKTLQRGSNAREKFKEEWKSNSGRFLQPVKRTKIQNFAAENVKRKVKVPALQKAITNAEGLCDAFICLTVAVAEASTFAMSFPSQSSLIPCQLHTVPFTENYLPQEYAQIFDGGLLLHSTVSQTNIGASYGSIAQSMLSTVCKESATEVHVCLDKYVTNSIKDSERKLRGAIDSQYTITGPDQKMLQNAHLQGDHEEADTLIAFHAATITAGHIIVRAPDTDVLVILICAIGSQRPKVRSMSNIILDCGMGNTRRFINVSNIVEVLEECKSGLPQALPGYHAFTGCDFTSAFYMKGKVKPFNIMKKDATRKFVEMFISMGDITGDVDADIASEFVCQICAQHKTRDVNEARYIKMLQMTGKVHKYVAALWRQATEDSPGSGLRPSDFWWNFRDNILQPTWFEGPAVPSSLFKTGDSDPENPEELDELIESEDEPWSEDSDSDQEDDNE